MPRPPHLALPVLCLALAACGGSNSNAPVDRLAAIAFGSTNPAEAANGLPYASDETNNLDLVGQNIKALSATNVLDQATGEGTIAVDTSVLEFIDGENFTVHVNGETLEFRGNQATRDNGDVLRAFVTSFEGASQIRISPTAPAGNELFNSNLVFGFETNPETIATLSGSARYGVFLFASGTLKEDGVPVAGATGNAGGFTILTADFDTGTVNGSGELRVGKSTSFDGAIQPLGNLDFSLVEADIVGNGFQTGLTATGCSNPGACSSDSQIGGVFYGENAEQLWGIGVLDLTITDEDGTIIEFEGSGAFVDASG